MSQHAEVEDVGVHLAAADAEEDRHGARHVLGVWWALTPDGQASLTAVLVGQQLVDDVGQLSFDLGAVGAKEAFTIVAEVLDAAVVWSNGLHAVITRQDPVCLGGHELVAQAAVRYTKHRAAHVDYHGTLGNLTSHLAAWRHWVTIGQDVIEGVEPSS